jgi:hypothetical protein
MARVAAVYRDTRDGMFIRDGLADVGSGVAARSPIPAHMFGVGAAGPASFCPFARQARMLMTAAT